MKKGFKIFLSIVLAASVLFASTGVVIASHICLKKNKSDISLFESKSCCKSHNKSCSPVPVIKKKCCQLSVSYHKLEVNSVAKSASALDEISIPVLVADITAPGLRSLQNTIPFTKVLYGNQRQIPGSKNFLYSIHLLTI